MVLAHGFDNGGLVVLAHGLAKGDLSPWFNKDGLNPWFGKWWFEEGGIGLDC